MKKSQLSIPFQWIFILVAGAIILIFFVNLVVKQKEVSDKKISLQIVNDLNTIIAGTGASQFDTTEEIQMPKTSISFICDKTGYSEYSVTGTGIHEQTPTEILFSLSELKGNKLIVWTLPWDMPFKIDNFMMLTSDNIRYVFVYTPFSEQEKSQIESDLPSNDYINYEFIKQNELILLQEKKSYKLRFVFIGDTSPESVQLPNFVKKMNDLDVSAVKISSSEGRIYFYRKKGNLLLPSSSENSAPLFATQFSIKDPVYYSAIFAEDAESYSCALKKAFRRLSFVSSVYKEKVKKFYDYYSQLPQENPAKDCISFYSQDNLDTISSNSYLCSKNLESCKTQYFNDIIVSAASLKESNRQTQQAAGCSWIY